MSPIPDPDEDFETPIESGGGRPAGGGPGGGHPQGSNGTPAKPQTGDLAAQCMRVPTLRNTPVTANRIPNSAPGIIVIAVRTTHPAVGGGPIHVMRARVPKKRKRPAATTCNELLEQRQWVAAQVLTTFGFFRRAQVGDRLELTYLDGHTETWTIVIPLGGTIAAVAPEPVSSSCPR